MTRKRPREISSSSSDGVQHGQAVRVEAPKPGCSRTGGLGLALLLDKQEGDLENVLDSIKGSG